MSTVFVSCSGLNRLDSCLSKVLYFLSLESLLLRSARLWKAWRVHFENNDTLKFHSNLLKMINICLKMFWIHAENVKSICLELHVAVRQFDPKQSLIMYAVLFWKSIVSLYQCVVYVMECPLHMKQPSIARSAILIEKINPLTAGCPVAFFEKVVAYLHARFSYKRGHILLRKFFMILKHNPEMCTAFL